MGTQGPRCRAWEVFVCFSRNEGAFHEYSAGSDASWKATILCRLYRSEWNLEQKEMRKVSSATQHIFMKRSAYMYVCISLSSSVLWRLPLSLLKTSLLSTIACHSP